MLFEKIYGLLSMYEPSKHIYNNDTYTNTQRRREEETMYELTLSLQHSDMCKALG